MSQIQVPVDQEVEYEVLPEHKPSLKVAVVVAGAALAVTAGLTILIIPYARQAGKIKPTPQFTAHRFASRPVRAPVPKPSEEPLHPDLVEARAFNDVEEARLYGRTVENEDGDEVLEGPIDPVSPLMGFQALAIATGIVGASAGLGIYGAAKYLGVSSMADFMSKMRGSVSETMPGLVENVRRVADDESQLPRANVLDRYGHLDDEKLNNWLRNFEPEKAEVVAEIVAAAEAEAAAGSGARPEEVPRLV